MRLFGGGKKKAPTPKEGITRMRETLDMLQKREEYLQSKIDHEVAEAKRFMGLKNKKAAMMCLKKKKAYEAQIEKISGANMTIQTQLMAIEGANFNKQTLEAMSMGARVMHDIHNGMSVEQVDRTMEEIQTQMEIATEIDQAISQPLGGPVYDEDELESELDALEQESLDQQLLSISSAPQTAHPTAAVAAKAPAGKVAPTQNQIDEDAELRALEESMAI